MIMSDDSQSQHDKSASISRIESTQLDLFKDALNASLTMIQNQKGSISGEELTLKLSSWYREAESSSSRSKRTKTAATKVRLDLVQIAKNVKQWIGEVYGIADRLDLIEDNFSQLDKTTNETFSQEELEQIIK